MRRNLWLLALALIAGCVFRGEMPPDDGLRTPWPDVIENDGLPKSAREMLEGIAVMPGVGASLSDAAEHRKTHPFEGCIGRVSWARVLVAYRYAEAGEKADAAGDIPTRDACYGLAETVLADAAPEDPEDPNWADETHGPSHSARQYLNFIKDKVVETPQNGGCSDPGLRKAILDLCDELLIKHADDDPNDPTVELGDPVAWARVVCAYYAGEYGSDWDLCKNELEHIDE